CDYPEIAARVARQVAKGVCSRGIIVDGAGIGSSMVANKFPGVRAALCYDVSSAKNSREHNDANVLTLGARMIGQGLAEQIASVFLSTSCSEERHQKRVAMIGNIAAEAAKCEACSTTSSAGASTGHFAIAGPALHKENAAPPERTAPSGEAAAFQARAAKWLSMDPSSSSTMSSSDLERVIARVVELMGAGAARGGMWCFGDVCVD